MNESFGARLRRARERRHITLAEIAERTKIAGSLFEALERDDVSRWPSGIFRRSFIRAYADAIGLDPAETVREFSERFPDPADAVRTPPASDAPLPQAWIPPEHGTPHAAPGSSPVLRLTLVETGLPFTGGRFIADVRRRWSAAAWDLGSLVAIAVSIFVLMDTFWMPFGITALCYYVGGILVLGNTPGVCLFAPVPASSDEAPPAPPRASVQEPAPAQPAPEHPFRTGGPPALRHGSELPT